MTQSIKDLNKEQAGTRVEMIMLTVIYASLLILYPLKLLSFNMATTGKKKIKEGPYSGLNKVPIDKKKRINTTTIFVPLSGPAVLVHNALGASHL